MKKLISCLLMIVMLLSVSTCAFAEPLGPIERNDALNAFLDETDMKTQDLVMQSQLGDMTTDLLIRLDGDTLHMVRRINDVEASHIQLNPTGIYLGAGDTVTLLRYTTVNTVSAEMAKALDAMLEQAAQNAPAIPENQQLSEAEMRAVVNKLAVLAAAAAAQEQADAVTLNSAAMSFASKFKPEYILDVKEEYGTRQISLRSDAFASAVADAVDEMLSNPALAELVDRRAAQNGDKTFAELQKDWLLNRESTLNAIRSIESTDTIGEDGHLTSHFQIGEEFSATKILMCDTDAWINAEDGEAEATFSLGFKGEDPFMTYAFEANPYSYWEKQTLKDSVVEMQLDYEDGNITDGKIVTVVDGNEELRADFGQYYMNMRGPKGGISTSVRETWTGRTRYELVTETADGEENTIIVDYYQDGDSLVCELNANDSDTPAIYRISRVDKEEIEDLTASKNITEITADTINAEMENILKMVVPAMPANTEAAK